MESKNKLEIKNKLAICALFNPELHGYDNTTSENIQGQHFIYMIIDIDDFYSNSYKEHLNQWKREYKSWILNKREHNEAITHPTICNYKNIIGNSVNYKINIVRDEILTPGQEHVGYINTFWLKIIQRKWRKVYNERKRILLVRKSYRAIKEREMTGKWPKHANMWPKFNLELKI